MDWRIHEQLLKYTYSQLIFDRSARTIQEFSTNGTQKTGYPLNLYLHHLQN